MRLWTMKPQIWNVIFRYIIILGIVVTSITHEFVLIDPGIFWWSHRVIQVTENDLTQYK